jgi:o-succinylbenzoate---CoA ligase
VTARLVALDLPGGPAFVDALQRVWDRGDAAFPVDRRLPAVARQRLLAAIAPGSIVDRTGDEDTLAGGRSIEPGDALVVATSGTTGEPRGVVLTHAAVSASAAASNRRLGVTGDDHWLACLPLSHVGGLSVITKALHGGTKLTVHPGFDADAVDSSSATRVSLVATALRRIEPARFRTILLGGSTPPDDLPANAVTTYGMTETGSGVVYDGVPLDGVELRIDGGEILVRGPMLLRSYRDGTDPFEDGWFRTGDLGRWEDGRLVVDGRRGDLILSGGENVWPEPVEAILRSHPAIDDVMVGPTPDDEWGQAVTAYVVVSGEPPSLDEVRDLVRSALPVYCAPRRLVVVDAIPRTNLGKIVRRPPAD